MMLPHRTMLAGTSALVQWKVRYHSVRKLPFIVSVAKTASCVMSTRIFQLPEGLSRAANGLRRFGMGRYPAELEVNLNRAAEAAVPELLPILLEAIARIDF